MISNSLFNSHISSINCFIHLKSSSIPLFNINDYIFDRKLLPANEKLVSEREIREDREIINGRALTDDDKEAIVRYLNITETPFYPRAYTLTRNKVLEGKLYIDKEEKVLKMKI